MQTLTITKPDDFHLHLRDGAAMASVINYSAAQFSRAIVMPNLVPPITNVDMAMLYRERILHCVDKKFNFEPLMTLYLTDDTSPSEITTAARNEHIKAIKYYPAGATTNSESGVTDLKKTYKALESMMKHDIPLLIHGEVNDESIDIYDREKVFIEEVLAPLSDRFNELRIVLEHISTRTAVDFILNGGNNIAATITPQHILLNRNDLYKNINNKKSFQSHNYCAPVVKDEEDRLAILSAATSGNPKFFLGTDSAPHARSKKDINCSCPGVFSAYNALELYIEIFDKRQKLDKFEPFASFFGADFYGLPRNYEKITLIKAERKIPNTLPYDNDKLVPLHAGETCAWQLKND
ncbi:MAG: dihydroorotase [Legionellales bacterium]|nr:dihydroorotase [Legionellales bacterium]